MKIGEEKLLSDHEYIYQSEWLRSSLISIDLGLFEIKIIDFFFFYKILRIVLNFEKTNDKWFGRSHIWKKFCTLGPQKKISSVKFWSVSKPKNKKKN